MFAKFKTLSSDQCDQLEVAQEDILEWIELADPDEQVIDNIKQACHSVGLDPDDTAILHGVAIWVSDKTPIDLSSVFEAIEIDASK